MNGNGGLRILVLYFLVSDWTEERFGSGEGFVFLHFLRLRLGLRFRGRRVLAVGLEVLEHFVGCIVGAAEAVLIAEEEREGFAILGHAVECEAVLLSIGCVGHVLFYAGLI